MNLGFIAKHKHYFKFLSCTILVTLLSACSALQGPSGDSGEFSFEIPIEAMAAEGEKNQASFNPQAFQPNDTLEILYRFDTTSEGLYRLSAHDQVSIKFLTAPEYDDIHTVGPDGYISLPFIGSMKMAGRTTNQITAALVRAYEPILKEPSFFVSVKEFHAHLTKLQELLDHPNYGQGRVVTVANNFQISLPLIGSMDVRDKSIEQIREEANQKYQSINKSLKIDVFVHELQPRNLYVMGEVTKPGAYRVDAPVTLFEAIALSGGASRQAKLSSVLVLRKHGEKVRAKVVNVGNAMKGKGELAMAMVEPNDVIYIPRTQLAKSSDVMRQVSSLMLFNGFGFGFSYRVDDKDEVDFEPQTP